MPTWRVPAAPGLLGSQLPPCFLRAPGPRQGQPWRPPHPGHLLRCEPRAAPLALGLCGRQGQREGAGAGGTHGRGLAVSSLRPEGGWGLPWSPAAGGLLLALCMRPPVPAVPGCPSPGIPSPPAAPQGGPEPLPGWRSPDTRTAPSTGTHRWPEVSVTCDTPALCPAALRLSLSTRPFYFFLRLHHRLRTLGAEWLPGGRGGPTIQVASERAGPA